MNPNENGGVCRRPGAVIRVTLPEDRQSPGTLTVYEQGSNSVLLGPIPVVGTGLHRNRERTDGDTPTGVYRVTGLLPTSRDTRDRMGPESRLVLNPLFQTQRTDLRVHSGRNQDVDSPRRGYRCDYSNAEDSGRCLAVTNGCIRTFDADQSRLLSTLEPYRSGRSGYDDVYQVVEDGNMTALDPGTVQLPSDNPIDNLLRSRNDSREVSEASDSDSAPISQLSGSAEIDQCVDPEDTSEPIGQSGASSSLEAILQGKAGLSSKPQGPVLMCGGGGSSGGGAGGQTSPDQTSTSQSGSTTSEPTAESPQGVGVGSSSSLELKGATNPALCEETGDFLDCFGLGTDLKSKSFGNKLIELGKTEASLSASVSESSLGILRLSEDIEAVDQQVLSLSKEAINNAYTSPRSLNLAQELAEEKSLFLNQSSKLVDSLQLEKQMLNSTKQELEVTSDLIKTSSKAKSIFTWLGRVSNVGGHAFAGYKGYSEAEQSGVSKWSNVSIYAGADLIVGAHPALLIPNLLGDNFVEKMFQGSGQSIAKGNFKQDFNRGLPLVRPNFLLGIEELRRRAGANASSIGQYFFDPDFDFGQPDE